MLFAGPAMNIIIGLVLIYGIAVSWGLPDLHAPTSAVIGETACVAPQVAKTGDNLFGPCPHPGAGPAAAAGLKAGDTVVKVGDKPVSTFEEMAKAIRGIDGAVRSTNAAAELTTTIIEQTQRFTDKEAATATQVGAIGVTAAPQRDRRSTTC